MWFDIRSFVVAIIAISELKPLWLRGLNISLHPAVLNISSELGLWLGIGVTLNKY